MCLFKKAETAGEHQTKALGKCTVSNVLSNMDGFVPLLNAGVFPGLDVP